MTDRLPKEASGFYAVAFDPKGKLGWESPFISDEDEGYDKAQVVEVLTEQADPRYLGYLDAMDIPCVIAGKTEIDVPLALEKLSSLMGIKSLLLEGGSVVNGYFQRAGVIDELSLVSAPVTSDGDGKPLFYDGSIAGYELTEVKQYDGGVIWTNYRRKQ